MRPFAFLCGVRLWVAQRFSAANHRHVFNSGFSGRCEVTQTKTGFNNSLISPSSRGRFVPSLLALLDYFAQIENRPYLNWSKSILKAWKLGHS